MSNCNLTANCDGTGDGGCFIDCCGITCPPENPCGSIILRYYCQPIGACCPPTGQDCYRTTQCQCEADGGSYQGDGTKCVPDNPCVKCDPPCDPNLCLECATICPVKCPEGCCPEENWICCPDSPHCAPTLGECPPTTCSGCVGWWKDADGVCKYTGNPPGTGGTAAPINTPVYTGPNGESNCNNYGYIKNLTTDICTDETPFYTNIKSLASSGLVLERYECQSTCDTDLNEICCHGNCCAENSVCCDDGTCCPQGKTCCLNQTTGEYACCDVCCGDGSCCDQGEFCCLDEDAGTYTCCNATANEICCHGNCCAENSVCCDDGSCCNQGQFCCLDEGAGTYTCCDQGEICCNGSCCPAGHYCCTESTTSPPYCSADPCPIPGCMNPHSPNYNASATCDDFSCRTCCNAGLCVVFDRDEGANCNDVGNGCCDEYCNTALDCAPSYDQGSGPLTSCDRDFDGTPFINEYTSCFSNDCVQGYLDPNIFSELEKNIENYNNSQVSIYSNNYNENQVFDQNNLETFDQNNFETYQTIKEYDFSMLNSCACVCPPSFRQHGLLINNDEARAMNAACTEYTITITTSYECGLTGEKTVSLAPCCCEGNFDENTYTVSASSSGDCLDFTWDNTDIKIGESRTITVNTGEDCECVYCGAECVPPTNYINQLDFEVDVKNNKIIINKEFLNKELKKRIKAVKKEIIKRNNHKR